MLGPFGYEKFVGQSVDNVTLSVPKGIISQVGIIGHAQVLEGSQQSGLKGLRKAYLGTDASAKIRAKVFSVHTFRGGGESNQQLRMEMRKEFPVAVGLAMMSFVNDDVVVIIGRELRKQGFKP